MQAQHSESTVEEDDPRIGLNVALDAAISIFTGNLGSYKGTPNESVTDRVDRYTALAWHHPALIAE
ncbi:hypothetical protein ACWC10_19080 [Streptomyces sp. NPDC001595]|uniref:hypothetical protein n=1 Tax=Streptomyces sp. NPDC001532 TaxID=3154520 RepID=UPI00331F2BC5